MLSDDSISSMLTLLRCQYLYFCTSKASKVHTSEMLTAKMLSTDCMSTMLTSSSFSVVIWTFVLVKQVKWVGVDEWNADNTHTVRGLNIFSMPARRQYFPSSLAASSTLRVDVEKPRLPQLRSVAGRAWQTASTVPPPRAHACVWWDNHLYI